MEGRAGRDAVGKKVQFKCPDYERAEQVTA
jgi:hypothetical protein